MKKLLLGLLALALGCVSLHAQDVTFTVLGGSNYQATNGEGCESAFDQDLSTKWFAGSGDSYVDIEASEAVYMTGFTLITANDNNGGRIASEWEFYGSNDENALNNSIGTWDGWNLISNVRGDNVNKGENFTAYYYAMNTPTSTYKYYRLKFVNAGWQLSEIIPSYSKTVLPTYIAINGVGGTGNEGYPNLFDGNTGSKLCTGEIYSPSGGPYQYVIFRRSNATNVTKYSFCTGNDSDNRDPVSWELYGMNSTTTPERTDAAWVLIDSKAEQGNTYPQGAEHRKEWVEYTVDNTSTDTYNTFMIKITKVRDGGNMTQFQEFRLNDDTNDYAAQNYVALDGIAGFNNESYDKTVDGNIETKLCTNASVTDGGYYWVIFKTIQDMAVSGYSFATGGDAPERDPQSWKLYGMKATSDPERAASGCKLIDTKTDVADFPTERKAWGHYDVSTPNSNEYNYFMLQVSKLRGNTNLVQFSEFKLDGLEVATEDKIVVYREGTGGTWDDGQAYRLFDGDPKTKLGGGFTNNGNGTYVSFGPASGESVSINGYTLQVAHEWGFYDRRPKSWTLYGSNIDPAPEQDRGEWEEIHSVSNDSQLLANPLVCGYYRLDQPSKPYKFFKIKFTETQGAGAIQVAELVLHYTHNDIANWIEIPDGTAPVFCGNITYKDFTYKRTFANEWATVCLPFEVQAKDGFQPYTLKENVDDERGKFLKVESTDDIVAPYQPTIVKATAGAEVDFSGSNIVVTGTLDTPTAATAATGWKLVGSTTNGNVDPGSVNGTMFYIAQNKFWQAEEAVTVNAMRAYLLSDGSTPAKFYDITEEDITGINTINGNASVNNAAIYDLQGRKVANVQRGVYIQNGKKFVVK